jgi:hypothetical protein
MTSRIQFIGAGTLIAIVALWFTLQRDHASLSITNVAFEPSPLMKNERERVAITLKNSAGNYGIIEGAAFDRVDELPDTPIYNPAIIAPAQIGGGGELRIISDVGTKPLIFTPAEIASLKSGRTEFKMAGFIKYSDRYWFLGGSVIGFCYVWDPKDTAAGNFSACPEKSYTYAYNYWFFDGISIHEVPMVTVGVQVVSPTAAPIRFPDSRFPIQTIETRTK